MNFEGSILFFALIILMSLELDYYQFHPLGPTT
jgi:hypothetical protein